jgi:voltage-gated potassium channel
MARTEEYVVSFLAAISIALIIVETVYTLTAQQLTILYILDAAIVAVLAADLVNRARQGGRKYILRNSYEILALIPAFLFAFLEQTTLLGAAFRGLRLLRLLRIIAFSTRGLRALRMLSTLSKQTHLGYLLAVSAVVVSVGTFSAYLLESDIPGARIRDLGDAFWWALATVTTVGYGDVVPVTIFGRAVGAVLMVSGIAILSVFISSLGAYLFSRTATASPKTLRDEVKEAIKKKVDDVESLSEEEVEELLQMIRTLHAGNKFR